MEDSRVCMYYAAKGALCDEHLMTAGISGVKHVWGNRYLSLEMRKWVAYYAGEWEHGEGVRSGSGSVEAESDVEFVGVCDDRGEVMSGGVGGGKPSILHRFMARCLSDGAALERDGDWTVLIPIFNDGHWYVVVVMREGPRSAMVQWGDGNLMTPATRLLPVVNDVY